jgi:hypothetical protein
LNQRSPTGGYPWRIEGTSVTETYIKNITDVEEDYVAFLLWENGGMYMIGRKSIAPHETVHINVKELRDQQIPDEKGRTIPQYISSGQLQWTLNRKDSLPDDDARANLSLMGRSEQVDLQNGIVNNYSCQNCCAGNHIGSRISPSSVEIEYGETAQFTAHETQETCYGFPYEYTVGANWTSSNSGMGTISGGSITPQSAGQSTIGASWYTQHYFAGEPCPPGGPFFTFGMMAVSCPNEHRGGPRASEAKSENVTTTLLSPACGECEFQGFTAHPSTAELTVKPKLIEIVPDVDTKKITLIKGNQNLFHFVTPKNSPTSQQVKLTATISPSTQAILNDISWEGAIESPNNPLEATISKSTALKKIVKIKYKNSTLKEMRVWIVWASISATTTHAIRYDPAATPVGNPPTIGGAVDGGYNFTHTIIPSSIITDTDIPDFCGSTSPSSCTTNTTAPPGGNHPIYTTQPLSAGADTKWDSSRQIRIHILNPFSISSNDISQPPYVGVSSYPINDVEGNDDSGTGDEINQPYVNNFAKLISSDRPHNSVAHRAGNDSDTFEIRAHFREFTRLEIEGVWYRISDFYPWKIHFRYIKVNGFWENDGSLIGLDNNGF